MISYKIIHKDTDSRPAIDFEGAYQILNELNSCETLYIVNRVLPNFDKVIKGKRVKNPNDESIMIDSYEFGYTAVMIEVFKDTAIINDTWNDSFETLEVPSIEMYKIMQHWRDCIIKWENARGK